jgi:hypothetical protein
MLINQRWTEIASHPRIWQRAYEQQCKYFTRRDHLGGCAAGESFDWRRFYAERMTMGWRLGATSDLCGASLRVRQCGNGVPISAAATSGSSSSSSGGGSGGGRDAAQQTTVSIDRDKLPKRLGGTLTAAATATAAAAYVPLDQVVLTERGMSQGKHTFEVRLDRVGWGTSVGIMKKAHGPHPTVRI